MGEGVVSKRDFKRCCMLGSNKVLSFEEVGTDILYGILGFNNHICCTINLYLVRIRHKGRDCLQRRTHMVGRFSMFTGKKQESLS